MLNWDEIRSNALQFQIRWAGAADERAEAQIFLYEFLRVFGVDPRRTATFERRVPRQGRNGYVGTRKLVKRREFEEYIRREIAI